MRKLKRTLVIGGVSLNTIIRLKTPISSSVNGGMALQNWDRHPGGTGLGKAANLSLLGFDTTLHAVLGDDEAGRNALQELRDLDIRLLIHRSQKETEQHINIMLPDGSRVSVYTSPPDNPEDFDPQTLSPSLRSADILIPSILPYVKRALPLLKAASTPIWVDLHDHDGRESYHEEFIDCADVLFFSGERMPDIHQFMRSMIHKGKHLVVCTLGGEGSLALDSRGEWHSCGICADIPVVDTNGAGDAYFSGFLFGYVRELSVKDCMRYGTVAAAACIQSQSIFCRDLSIEFIESKLAQAAFCPPSFSME